MSKEANMPGTKDPASKFWHIKATEIDSPYTPDCIEDSDIPLITEQIHDLRSEYISIQSSFLTVTSIAFAGLGVILYYAFSLDIDNESKSNFINYVFVALPFLFGIGFLNILKYTVRMMGLGSYISHLEKLLNAKTKKNLFLWHKKLVGINGYTIVGLAQIPCYLALVVVIGYKFFENMRLIYVYKAVAPWIIWLIWILIALFFVFGIFSIGVASTQHNSVGYWSKFLFNTPSDVEINTHVFYKRHRNKISKAQKAQTSQNTY